MSFIMEQPQHTTHDDDGFLYLSSVRVNARSLSQNVTMTSTEDQLEAGVGVEAAALISQQAH